MRLTDGLREIRGLRKQRLPLKAKFYCVFYVCSPKGDIVKVLSNSSFLPMNRDINLKRGVLWAAFNAIYISMSRYGFPTGSFICGIEDYGFLYLGRETETGKKKRGKVTIKTFKSGGKRRVGVWVKGRKGMKYNFKYKQEKLNVMKILKTTSVPDIAQDKEELKRDVVNKL